MSDSGPFVSRGGLKLDAALQSFDIQVGGLVCADFGSHVGGFVDCLLQRGAAKVHAIDPGYGVLDSRLRRDPRVVVHERTNALRFATDEKFDLITIDVGWTPQRLILPVAARCLKPAPVDAHAAMGVPRSIGVITLIKPHYEALPGWLKSGVLADEKRDEVFAACLRDCEALGWTRAARIESPLPGHGGNREELWWLRRT